MVVADARLPVSRRAPGTPQSRPPGTPHGRPLSASRRGSVSSSLSGSLGRRHSLADARPGTSTRFRSGGIDDSPRRGRKTPSWADETPVVKHTPMGTPDEARLNGLFTTIQELIDNDLEVFQETLLVELCKDRARMGELGVELTESSVEGIGPSLCIKAISKVGIFAEYNQTPSFITKLQKESMQEFRGSRLKVAAQMQTHDEIIEVNQTRGALPMRQRLLEENNLQLIIVRRQLFEFKYKARWCVGSALHVASLYWDFEAANPGAAAVDVVDWLLEKQSNVSEEVVYQSRGSEGRVQAIHLAAGRGNCDLLELLIDKRADPNARTKLIDARFGVRENYSPLHDACSFGNIEAVRVLLQARADVESRNVRDTTPLHMAAKMGNVELAQLLVKSNASTNVQDKSHSTPLMVAVEYGRFPHRKLHHVCERTLNDVLIVANLCPSAASTLMKDAQNQVHESWGEDFRREQSNMLMPKLARLLTLAPQAGEDVMQALTETPVAQDDINNPLPRRARLQPGEMFKCHYCPAEVWQSFERDADMVYQNGHRYAWKEWQRNLAPGIDENRVDGSKAGCCSIFRRLFQPIALGLPLVGGNGSEKKISSGTMVDRGSSRAAVGELVPVNIRRVRIPGFLCPSLLQVLANTEEHHVFVKLQTQAILMYAWENIVRFYYFRHLIFRVLEIAALAMSVVQPPEDSYVRRTIWSFLLASFHRELLYESLELWNSLLNSTANAQPYFLQWKNYVDSFSIIVSLCLLYVTNGQQRLGAVPPLLALVSFTRWVQLAYTFRAFPWAGQKILPILKSISPMGGIFLVTAFFFFGFAHAFLALELTSENPDVAKVMIGAARLLLLGDGDGVNVVLGLGGVESEQGSPYTVTALVVATFVFCICILNLFIAVHGEAYDSAQERAVTSFLQERSAICLQCLSRPYWPPPCCRRRPLRRVVAGSAAGQSTAAQDGSYAPEPEAWHITWPRATYTLSGAFAVPVWVFMAQPSEWHPFWSSCLLFCWMVLGDMILMQRPWNVCSDGQDRNYLWICSRQDYNESAMWPGAVSASTPMDGVEGRLAGLKRDNMLRHQRLNKDVEAMRINILDSVETLAGDVNLVGGRLDTIESTLDKLLAEVRHRERDTQEPVALKAKRRSSFQRDQLLSRSWSTRSNGGSSQIERASSRPAVPPAVDCAATLPAPSALPVSDAPAAPAVISIPAVAVVAADKVVPPAPAPPLPPAVEPSLLVAEAAGAGHAARKPATPAFGEADLPPLLD